MTDTLELPPPGEATYADLEALPERYVGELIDGTLYATGPQCPLDGPRPGLGL